jgi:hypothetical protein
VAKTKFIKRNGTCYAIPWILIDAAEATGVDPIDFIDGLKAALQSQNMALLMPFLDAIGDFGSHKALLNLMRSVRVFNAKTRF